MNQIPRSTLVPTALLAGLCPLVANSIYEDTTGNGAKILAEAAAGQPVAAKISVLLFLVGFVALIVVLGVLAAAIARRTPALSGIVAVAGAAAVAIKLSEAQTGMALRQTTEGLDPGTAEALVAIDEAGFAVHGFLLALALGAAGLGLLRSGVMGGLARLVGHGDGWSRGGDCRDRHRGPRRLLADPVRAAARVADRTRHRRRPASLPAIRGARCRTGHTMPE